LRENLTVRVKAKKRKKGIFAKRRKHPLRLEGVIKNNESRRELETMPAPVESREKRARKKKRKPRDS